MDEKQTYSLFLAALNHILKNELSAMEVSINAKVSEAYISQIKNKKRQAGFKGQVKIAAACGYGYLAFLELGKSIVESGSQNTDTKKTQPPDTSSEDVNNKKTRAVEKATIQSTIRIYNNVLNRTGLKLDAEGQEKLFNLIKKLLQISDANETEDEVYNIIRIDQYKASGDGN